MLVGQEFPDCPDLKATEADQDELGPGASLADLVTRVRQVQLDHLGLSGQWDPLEPPENVGVMEALAQRVYQEATERMGKEVHLAPLVHLDHQDFQAQPEQREMLDNPDHEDLLVYPDPLELMVTLGVPESPGHPASLEKMANQEVKEKWVHRVLLELPDFLDPTGPQVCLVQLDHQDRKAKLEATDSQAQPVIRACAGHQVPQEM